MTKKHYTKIANIIKNNTIIKSKINNMTCLCKESLIDELCDVLKEDNSSFDRKRFIDACQGTGADIDVSEESNVNIIEKSRGLVFFSVGDRFYRLEDNSYFRHYELKTGWTLMELVSCDEDEDLTTRDVLLHNYDAMMMDVYNTKMECLLQFENNNK